MRLLIVAAPCVGCCRGSRHYSTSAWHQCLFQFHLIALVIKLGTDTTHHIIALITSELHCVHMTISLTQTPIPAASLFALSVPLSLYFPSQIWPPPLRFIHHTRLSSICTVDKWHSLYNDSFSDHFHYLVCKIIHPQGRLLGVVVGG